MKKKTESKEKLQLLVASESAIKSATFAIRVIDNKYRQQILHGLHQLGEASVTELYVHLRMQQEVCSIHLKALRDLGLVKVRRNHKAVYYSINSENLSLLLSRIFEVSKQLQLKVSRR